MQNNMLVRKKNLDINNWDNYAINLTSELESELVLQPPNDFL